MKTSFYIILINLFFCTEIYSQGLVSTSIEKKNFLIEKGTGHVCGSCPEINLRCDSVIDSHPGRGMLIEYHFGPDAYPQAPPLDQDFTTPYGDTIYEPIMLNWPFYLNMMVNRRDQGFPYGSTFIFGVTNQVQEEADTVVNQNADVNIGFSSQYDMTTRLLTINVEAYYTSTSSTALNFLQVVLTEDSIVGMQYDGSYPLNNHFNPDFLHMNTFRDNINGFGGDTITTTTAGTLISRTYTYTVPIAYKNVLCNPFNCNLTVYIAEEKAATGQQSFTGKVINAVRARVGSGVVSEIQTQNEKFHFEIYPNPSNGNFNLVTDQSSNERFEIVDMIGKSIYSGSFRNGFAEIDLSRMSNGIYFLKSMSEKTSDKYKLVLAR